MLRDQILSALPKLSKADLIAIHGAASHILGATAAPQGEATPQARSIFSALQATLGASISIPAATSTLGQHFYKKLPTVIGFLDMQFKGWDTNKITEAAFLRMLFGLLANDLTRRGIKPSLGVMVVHLHRLSEVFGNSFPGYIEAGLGKMILKQFQQEK
jgi:hypothetical protein